MRLIHIIAAGAVVVTMPLLAGSFYEVQVRVEPPQAVSAITIRSGAVVRSVDVREGKAIIPTDVPLPWTLGLNRFEPLAYTREDLAKGNPLLLRELGIVQGMLRRPSAARDDRFIWLVRRGNADDVDEIDIKLAGDGHFEFRLAAGVYEGAALGSSGATRIRPGIVVHPGKTTDLGPLICDPTIPVSLRVIDGRSGAPLSARVVWDPPSVLNAEAARILYGKRWSASTNSRGIVNFLMIGPLPIPVRWRVEAKGYSTQLIARELIENERVTLPDVRLRPEPALIVRVRFPRAADDLEDASIVIAEPADPRTRRFVPVTRAPLREGEMRFVLRRYGVTRMLIESAAGKPLLYQDVDVDADTVPVDLLLDPLEVHGSVTRRGEPAQGAQVWLSDPDDGRLVLAKAVVDDDGEYSLTTYQTGTLRLHTLEGGGPGRSTGPVMKRFTTDGRRDYRVDFDLLASGATIVVVDATSRAPLRARVDKRVELKSAGISMGVNETDAKGRLVLSGYADGVAKLSIHVAGYRARQIEIPLRETPEETVVALERSQPMSGRVVDVYGAPIQGARVTGGYRSEFDMQAPFVAATDQNGSFEFDSTPDPGTMFYVAAARYALGMTPFQTGSENVIVLYPPGTGVVSLRPNRAMPTRTYAVLAAPVGGPLIPSGALNDLGEVNGMTPYQLLGSQKDGSIVLPQFLQPGTYELYVALQGVKPYQHQRVGSITLPTQRNVVIAYQE